MCTNIFLVFRSSPPASSSPWALQALRGALEGGEVGSIGGLVPGYQMLPATNMWNIWRFPKMVGQKPGTLK